MAPHYLKWDGTFDYTWNFWCEGDYISSTGIQKRFSSRKMSILNDKACFISSWLEIGGIMANDQSLWITLILRCWTKQLNYSLFQIHLPGITWCVVSIATPLLLSIVSCGRFLALYMPHSYDSFFTPRLSTSLIVLSWLIRLVPTTALLWIWDGQNMWLILMCVESCD